MTTRFDRRAWLKAAGCGGLALPLLDGARAHASAPVAPLRIVIVYTPNGTVPKNWFPVDPRSESEFELGSILTPLAPFRDRLTLLSGIDSAVGLDPSNPGGPHQRGIGSLFTGERLGAGEFKDGCGQMAGWPAGPSLDQVVARIIGEDTPFRSLEFGVRCYDNDVQGRISYSAADLPLPPMNDPGAAYSRLFRPSTPIDPSDPNGRARSVLDAVHGQFTALRKRVGRDDRAKLDAHVTLLRDLERQLGLGVAHCDAPEAPPALDPESEDDMPLVSRAHLDLLAAAFACDLTRVASLQYSTGFNRIRYPWLGSLGEGHSLSHAGESNVTAWGELTSRLTWHASELAYFIDRLQSIPEGDGTVFDNTLILWGSEVHQGNTHALTSLPYLILGDAGGRIRTGIHATYDGRSNAELLLTIARAYGYEEPSFGAAGFCDDVLSGLLV